MKQVSMTIIAFIAYLGATFLVVWAINLLINSINIIYRKRCNASQKKYSVRKSAPLTDAIFKKSRFQDRLEQMANERNKKQNK